MIAKKSVKNLLFVLTAISIQFFSMNSYADTSSSNTVSKASAPSLTGGTGGTVSGSGTVMPDLFTGTMSYSIPIEVPAGRKGMDPGLALTYRSDNESGWVGVGWDLDVGAIERNASHGINYSGDDVLLHVSGSAINLIYDTANNFYRVKIEGGFIKVTAIKDISGNIISWVATDKAGTQYFYGSTAASRQDNPADATKIFKWCLDKVQDTNGNYMNLSYFKDQGQIYLDEIDYTGNTNGAPTTNYVKFYRESRTDAPVMYSTNFNVTTAYRLKTIDVVANGQFPSGNRVRTYELTYTTSASTSRSILATVQQYGKDGGTSLPPVSLTYGTGANSFIDQSWSTTAINWNSKFVWTGDFNGDGKTDIAAAFPDGTIKVWLSNGSSFITPDHAWTTTATNWGDWVWTGDFNGDGKTDIAAAFPDGTIKVWLANADGTGFVDSVWSTTAQNWVSPTFTWAGDFNGDGKTDIAAGFSDGSIKVWLANADGTGFITPDHAWTTTATNWGDWVWTGDFNGDGKTDIAVAFPDSTIKVWLANADGTGFVDSVWSTTAQNWASPAFTWAGDFNGDGKTDIAAGFSDGSIKVWLSNGSSFITPDHAWTTTATNWSGTWVWAGDFNGDGKMDLAAGLSGVLKVWLSTGTNFTDSSWSTDAVNWDPSFKWAGDFNGDGKTDLCAGLSGTLKVWQSNAFSGDLLTAVSNGLGGTTTIAYTPSTQYNNTQLPFPIQTVSSVTTCDNYDNTTLTCKGNSSTTTYNYSGGFYHIGGRDFRGFNYVKTTGPTGPNGEQRIVETWFHQGNDTAVDANSPNVPTGYMKGKPYRTRISDASGAIYTETTTIYSSGPSTAPFFNPPLQVDTYNCDGKLGTTCAGNAAAQHIQTVFNTYDQYGNVTSEYQSGDINDSTDTSARTISRTYLSNATAWIINLPTSETIYSAVTGSKMSSTSYYYDGITACTTASTGQPPTKGNLTCLARWVDGGANDPSVGMTYDAYGNLLTTRDPRGNTSRIGYDGTSTFPTTATNALGQNTTMQYYAGTSTDAGLYGQVQSVMDPNGAVTTMTYDTFGRKTRVTAPDGTWMSWSYPITPGTGTSTNVFGAVGSQNNEIDTSAGISSWIYFDGLGRTIAEKKTGINGKVVTTTSYNKTGTVAQTSLPYFENTQQPSLITYTYDAMGRITRVNNPDGTSVSSCYDNGVTVVIDANTHFKRTTKNVHGKLVKVEEYEGTLAGCTTNIGTTPYAKTTYSYDVLGNLLSVTDNKLNITQMRYDSLGRKIYMSDPDMGVWQYGYDLNGNLLSQTDAKGQIITFTYDALNRVKLKHYQTGTDVSYTYDVRPDASSTITYPVGRRSTMTDASGSTKYFYDIMGRSSTMTKTVDGTPYTTVASYDNGGRLASLRYPDTDVINYFYDAGGNLKLVSGASTTTNYATYSNYNALGQPGNIAYGNGVNTTYTYNASNNRLTSLITKGPNSTALLNLSYDGYDNVGNITHITDSLTAARSQTFTYDDLNRLYNAQSGSYGSQSYVYDEIGNILSKEGINYDQYGLNAGPHAVTHTSDGKAYTYDANGNMLTDGSRVITYNYDNMPQSITVSGVTTTFIYDGSGMRVKKIRPSATTVYIGKLYECVAGACSKYIFAGGTRIAHKASDTVYFTQDHLGSTRVVTDAYGNKSEDIYYYPFGGAQSDSGAVSMTYKYTSQEFDAETGLYNYNARLYNPSLGRFISPDTIVPDPSNPQAFNRYSYVYNNPMRYVDPFGHWGIRISYFAGPGGEVSYDFSRGRGSAGVGFGAGGGASVYSGNSNIGFTTPGYNVQAGYETYDGGGTYASGTYSPTGTIGGYGYSISGSYYFRSKAYQVGVRYGYVTAGYSNYGGYGAGLNIGMGDFGAAGGSYNFKDRKVSYGLSVNAGYVINHASGGEASGLQKNNDNEAVGQGDEKSKEQIIAFDPATVGAAVLLGTITIQVIEWVDWAIHPPSICPSGQSCIQLPPQEEPAIGDDPTEIISAPTPAGRPG